MENNVIQSIDEIKRLLGKTIKQAGTAFYSNIATLTNGKYLIVGLNPGGDPNEITDTIEKSFTNFKNESYNAFFQKWYNNNPERVHRLQKNFRELFKILENDENYLKKVCATNLFYERTKRETDFNSTVVQNHKLIIEYVINIVQPEIIFTFGKKPFYTLKDLFDPTPKFLKKPSGHGNWKILLASGTYKKRQTKLIGFPHLSIYTLYTRRDEMDWIKQFSFNNSNL